MINCLDIPTTAYLEDDMTIKYSYACKTYPGMDSCPGHFVAASEEEVWKLMELHASVAHGEDPKDWSEEDRRFLKTLIQLE